MPYRSMGPRRVTLRDDAVKQHRFRPGESILDRYIVIEELGQGGMGVVYKCRDKIGGVEVAVKGVPPEVSHNSGEMEGIRKNYQLVRCLRHPNIAGVTSLEEDVATQNYYLVMDFAPGENLERWLKHNHDAGVSTKIAILRQVAMALDYAHSSGVIHRDIKPENIMVDPDGRVSVLDFGLAERIRTSMSRLSKAVTSRSGTPGYKSPEQWRAQPQGCAADMYALGVVAYVLFAGHLPFDSDDLGILRLAVLNDPMPQISSVPDYVNDALKCALAKKPEDRFSTCERFVAALEGEEKAMLRNGRQNGFRDFNFSLDRDEFEWDAKEHRPNVIVKPADGLVRGKDYDLDYDENNIDVGEATVVVLGRGRRYRCCDPVVLSFRIVPRQMSRVSVADIRPCEYEGKPVFPAISVSDPGRGVDLEQGRDYQVKVLGAGMAGTAEVEIVGMGNYRGRVKKTFQILRRDIANAAILFLGTPEYNGRPVRPKIAIRDNGLARDLREGEDYFVEYGSDVEREGRLTVVGMGNYDGTLGMPFTIMPRDIGKASVDFPQSVRFDGHPISTLAVKVQDSELKRELKDGVDYRVVCRNANGPGTGIACVRGLGRYCGELTREFEISKGRFDVVGKLTTRIEYDGKPHGIDVGVRGAPKGVKVLYSRSQAGPYATEPITMRDVCKETTVWFRVTCAGYKTFQGKGTVEVRPRQLTRQTIDVSVEPPMANEDVSACPIVKLVDKSLDKVLVLKADYTLESRNTGREGFGCVVIKGKGNYTGEIVEEFAFRRLRGILAENVVFQWPSDVGEVSAIVRDSEAGKFLKQGTDFRLEVWNDRPELGWMMAKVTGVGGYDGEIIGRHMKVDRRFESLLLCLSGLRYAMYKGDAYLVKLKADVEGRSIALTDLLGGVTIDLNGFRIVSGKRPPFILAHDEDAMQRLGFVGDFPEVGMPLPEWKRCATSLKIVNSRPGANSGVYCDCDEVVSVSRGTSWMATFALDDGVVRRGGVP